MIFHLITTRPERAGQRPPPMIPTTIRPSMRLSAADAAVGLTPAAGATSTPVVHAPSILKKMATPLETAELGLERLVLKLQWTNQITAYRELGKEFLNQYSTWYYECQSIESAEALGAYQPSACRVKSKFLQPIERAKEGTAYQSLRARADAKFYHHKVLRELCDLEEFVSIYKRIHKCGRDAEDPDVMYVRRFGTAEESDGIAPPAEHTNTSPIQASAVQNVNENPPMSVETSKMSTPIAKLFEEPSELTIEAINKHWQDKVAFLLALGLPESKNIQQVVEISKQLQHMSTFGQQLISQVGGVSSTIASKLAADMNPNANEGSAESREGEREEINSSSQANLE
eukprot:scaffold83164_cov31-Cyclotella_meneghiniana.AAC.1